MEKAFLVGIRVVIETTPDATVVNGRPSFEVAETSRYGDGDLVSYDDFRVMSAQGVDEMVGSYALPCSLENRGVRVSTTGDAFRICAA